VYSQLCAISFVEELGSLEQSQTGRSCMTSEANLDNNGINGCRDRRRKKRGRSYSERGALHSDVWPAKSI
jgi:hypothetical protein